MASCHGRLATPEAIMLPLLNPRPRVVIDDFMLEAEALVGHAANNRRISGTWPT